MKQPELGKKLAEFRNEKGLTQEQVSEKSRINIRTIQRIESGEVTPRVYTLQTIMEILGRDYKEINGDSENIIIKKPAILKKAWVAGIILAVCYIIYIVLIVLRDVYGMKSVIHLIAPLLLLFIVLNFFLNFGIIRVGKIFENSFLVVTGYFGFIIILFCDLSYIARLYVSGFNLEMISKIFLVVAALNGVFYGVGILLLKKYLNDLALLAGFMIVSANVLFIVPVGIVEVFAIIISIPGMLLQALILYRIQTQQINIC